MASDLVRVAMLKLEEAIVYLMAGSGNTANSSTRSYGMSLMRALQPSSGRRVRLARLNI